MVDKKAIGFIFARGGSKGVKGKNIKLLNGKPLIAYSIECALSCPSISRVIVSTDSQEIVDIAKKYGAEVPFMRPSQLAQDDSPEWLAWQHAVQFLQDQGQECDVFVSLPATSPLRNVEDVEATIALLDEKTDVVVTCTPAKRHPSFNMLKKNDDGYVSIVMPVEKEIHNRQQASELFDMTTVAYVTRPQYIINHQSLLETGAVKAHSVPEERALDIDTMFDFKIAQLLMEASDAGK